MSSQLFPVPRDQAAKAYATLLSAFTKRPCRALALPGAEQYRAQFPEFLAAFGGKAFHEETVWSLVDFSAVALWLPPGTEADGDAITTVLTETVSPQQHGEMFSVLEQMDAAHPSYPHWYLPWFGVHVTQQASGLGSELIRPCLEIV
ncbi:MAG: hypothetical protein ABI873_11920, partial [Marmoricola sp.]